MLKAEQGTFVRKRTVTTIETHQIVIVRRPEGATLAWCQACLEEVVMVPLEEAALLAGVRLRDICRRVGEADIHFIETTSRALICLPSLLKNVSPGDGEPISDPLDIQPLGFPDLGDDSTTPGS